MLPAPHPDEDDRLRTLHAFGILDTPAEKDFGEIVALASQICETPISLISFVDADRQWFKAGVGLAERETGLDRSVCAHAILGDDYLEIPDTLADPRTADNPLVHADPNMRFYAGATLVASNGLPLGTLCVLDSRPRQLNDLQRQTLRILSRQVMKQLELRLALRNQETLLHEADHRVKNSLQTLGSMMRLYGRKLTDPPAVEAFEAIRRRIDAISALHGELQSSPGTNLVNARRFLERIVELLQDAAPANVTITCDAADIDLRHGATSALGVIVSEFVANAIKHAFPGGRTGTVTIRLWQTGAGVELTCRDDGIGAQGDPAAPSASENLGSSLVAAAASQLEAALTTRLTDQGCTLTLLF